MPKPNTDAISYLRLAGFKFNLRIEAAGMRVPGGATRPKLAREFNLSPRAPHSAYITECQRRMDEILQRADTSRA